MSGGSLTLKMLLKGLWDPSRAVRAAQTRPGSTWGRQADDESGGQGWGGHSLLSQPPRAPPLVPPTPSKHSAP